jgi:hypothetical protein
MIETIINWGGSFIGASLGAALTDYYLKEPIKKQLDKIHKKVKK